MAATSIGALNSWGIYLASAFALLLILGPALTAATRDAREGVDFRNLDGVRAVLTSLTPGATATFVFGSSASGDPIRIGGGELSSSYGGGTVVAHCTLDLPVATLYPAVVYRAYLSGGAVVVSGG